MLNHKAISRLSNTDKATIVRGLEVYDNLKDGQQLAAALSRLNILIEPTCCGISLDRRAEWTRHIIRHDFNPPL